MKYAYVGLIILSFVAIVAASGCVSGNCRTVQQPYLEEQCTETSTGESCGSRVLKFSASLDKDTECSSRVGYSCSEETTTCTLKIVNNDNTEGRWEYSMKMILNGNPIDKGKQQILVYSNSAQNLIWTQTHAVGATVDCQYKEENVPTKTVCEVCQNVTKYRETQICD